MGPLRIIFIMLFFSSCVSVNLPTSRGQKASQVIYRKPNAPFSDIRSNNADQAWLSSVTGNTISFISECNNPADPPLHQIESETLSVMTDLKVLSSQNINFNSREGLHTVAEGQVDGIPVKMKLLSFKKNSCNYSLIFGGLREKLDAEDSYFNDFLQEFKAP